MRGKTLPSEIIEEYGSIEFYTWSLLEIIEITYNETNIARENPIYLKKQNINK